MPNWYDNKPLKQKITNRSTRAVALMRRIDRPGHFFMVHLPSGQSWVSIAIKPSKLMADFPTEVTGNLGAWNVSAGDIAWDGKKLVMSVRSAVGAAKSKGSGLKGSEVRRSLKSLKEGKLKFLKGATIGAIQDPRINNKPKENSTHEESPTSQIALDDEVLKTLANVADSLTEEDVSDLLSEIGNLEVQVMFLEQLLTLDSDEKEDDPDDEIILPDQTEQDDHQDPGPVDFSPRTDVTPPTDPQIVSQDGEQDVDDEVEEEPKVGEWINGRYLHGEDVQLVRNHNEQVKQDKEELKRLRKRSPWRTRFYPTKYFDPKGLVLHDKKAAEEVLSTVSEMVHEFALSAIALDNDLDNFSDDTGEKEALNARIQELLNVSTYKFQITFSVLKSYLKRVRGAIETLQKKNNERNVQKILILRKEEAELMDLGQRLDQYQLKCLTGLRKRRLT